MQYQYIYPIVLRFFGSIGLRCKLCRRLGLEGVGPARRVGGGLCTLTPALSLKGGYAKVSFRGNHSCSLAACTTSNESRKRVHCRHLVCRSDRRWIPAPYRWYGVTFFRGNDGCGGCVFDFHTNDDGRSSWVGAHGGLRRSRNESISVAVYAALWFLRHPAKVTLREFQELKNVLRPATIRTDSRREASDSDCGGSGPDCSGGRRGTAGHFRRRDLSSPDRRSELLGAGAVIVRHHGADCGAEPLSILAERGESSHREYRQDRAASRSV